jgi:hypothetical protein
MTNKRIKIYGLKQKVGPRPTEAHTSLSNIYHKKQRPPSLKRWRANEPRRQIIQVDEYQ